MDFSFLPEDEEGRTLPVLLSGATGAIGAEILKALLESGVPVVMACRSEGKALALAGSLGVDIDGNTLSFLPLDLGSEQGVRRAVASLPDALRLSGIIHNAGIMCRHFHIGADGREDTVNVNYFNTRLLNELLLPRVAKGGAIVFTTSLTRFSRGHHNLPESVAEEDFGQLRTYGLSKKLITAYASRLSRLLMPKHIRVNCADPGIVNSGMIHMDRWFDPLADRIFRPFIRSPRGGAIPALRALAAPDSGHIFGRYSRLRL